MPNKGEIAVGMDADLVMVDPSIKHQLNVDNHHHNVDYNAYQGMELTGKVMNVMARGEMAIWQGSAKEVEKGRGKFIKRTCGYPAKA